MIPAMEQYERGTDGDKPLDRLDRKVTTMLYTLPAQDRLIAHKLLYVRSEPRSGKEQGDEEALETLTSDHCLST
jgi:hypothetical protein